MSDENNGHMSYRQIKSYAHNQRWDVSPGGYDWNLARDGVTPCDVTVDPPAVCGWFVREVMPAIQRTGQWMWPDNLDVIGTADYAARAERAALAGRRDRADSGLQYPAAGL
jgi:hypothetical protein